MLTLNHLLTALTGAPSDLPRLVITEASVDSRQVIPGALFVALKGERTDGHLFVGDAFARGAAVALVEQESAEYPCVDMTRDPAVIQDQLRQIMETAQPFALLVPDSLKALQRIAAFWRRSLSLMVVGVTGSVGKSTTKELIADVLGQQFHTLKNYGNLNNEIGLPLTVLRLTSGYEAAVLEMGFYVPGEIALLCEIAQPQIGVVTNIGTVHAERAGSQEAIARGKAELVQALPADGYAVLNYDDPLVLNMAGMTKAKVFTYGLDPRADLWADEVASFGLEGIAFRLHYQDDDMSVRVPLIGRHSVHTALRAAAVGILFGIPLPLILQGMKSSSTQLRLMAVQTTSGALLIDDSYNAAPESTMAALNLLSEMQGRKIAVLGDMLELGPYERMGHEMVGVRAGEVADFLLGVGPLSRMVLNSAQRSGLSAGNCAWAADAEEARGILEPMLHAGDVVLVKGSHGMRLDRLVSGLEVEG